MSSSERSYGNSLDIDQSIGKFEAAQELENKDTTFIQRIYSRSATLATRSIKNSKKDPEDLPFNRIYIPLVQPDSASCIMAQSLDLQLTHFFQREAANLLSQIALQGRVLLFDDGKKRMFGILIRTCPEIPFNVSLQPGTTGSLQFVGRTDMKPWIMIISHAPRIALGTDVYGVVYPPKDEDGDIPLGLPKHIIHAPSQFTT